MGVMMICDKCDQPITGQIDNRTRVLVRVLDISSNKPDGKEIIHYDLCAKCTLLLREFVEGVRPTPKSESERVPGPPSPPKPPPGNKMG
jgi:hypothetical protein